MRHVYLMVVMVMMISGVAQAAPVAEPKVLPDGTINAAAFTSFSSCKANPIAVGKTITVKKVMNVNTLTVPATQPVKFVAGGRLNVASGKTLTISVVNNPGQTQIFSGAGTVTGLKEAMPDWWTVNTTPGTTDMYAAINAALNAVSGGFVNLDGRTYATSTTIRIPNYVRIKGRGGNTSTSGTGSIIKAIAGTWAADRGVIETLNFDWPNGFPGGSTKPDFATGNSIEDVVVDANSLADYGIVIWCPNEQSTLRRVAVFRAVKDGIFLGGYMSVMQVEDSSTFSNGRYGVAMTNHPNAGFAPAVTSANGGRGNGGSVRFYGISGDSNPSGLLYADGTQAVEASGIKSEYNFPAIKIAGSGTGNVRQRWHITGHRAEFGTSNPTRDFVNISGTAQPQVLIGSGTMANAINIINDTVNSKVLTKGAEGFFLFYDYQQPLDVQASYMDLYGSLYIAAPSTTEFSMSRTSAAGLRMVWDLRDTTTRYRLRVGTTPSEILTIDSNTGNEFSLWGYNGSSATAKRITLNTAGINIGVTAGDKIGFYQATPVVKPTGVAVDAASIHAALVSLGLIAGP